MPKRPLINELPSELKAALDKRLIEEGFQNYQALSAWLGEKGFEISKSSLHRYGQHFEEKIQSLKLATEQARTIAETVGDDENSLGDALTRLAQQKAFQALLDISDQGSEKISFPTLVRAISDLNRSSVTIKRFRSEVLKKLNETLKLLEKDSGAVSGVQMLEKIRKEVYGIFEENG